MDGNQEISRRSALGVLGVLGTSVILSGDAEKFPVPRPHTNLAPVPTVQAAAAPSPTPTPSLSVPVPVRRKPVRYVHDLVKDPPKHGIALTIDDGPHPEWTPKVLDLLDKHEVKATFFVIGEQVPDNAKLVREIVEAGHGIANHTQTHPLWMPGLTAKQIEREITEAYLRIHETTGATPHLFRAPGGNWSPKVFKAIAHHGLHPIDWDIDPRDWARPGVNHIEQQMMRARGGDILLCHDGGGDRSQTVASLRYVLPRLQDRGLEFIRL
ncbi:MAG: polysaccharide deacetylase family protein [Streptosporangiaceae bacterium]